MGYALVGQDIFDEFDKDNSDQLSAWAEKSDSRSRATNMAQTTLATDKLFDLLGYQNSEGIQLNHIPLIYLYIFYFMIIINTYTYIVSPIYIHIYILYHYNKTYKVHNILGRGGRRPEWVEASFCPV